MTTDVNGAGQHPWAPESMYIGIGEAGRFLGVARTTLYRMIDAGQLEAIRTPGGHRRILRASAKALRHSLTVRPQGSVPEPAPTRQWTAEAGVQPVPVRTRPEGRTRALQVLLVDDDLVMLTWLRHMVLRVHPAARICTAGDTTQAVAVLQHLDPPDLVITDLSMPVDGFRLVWWLHVKPEYQSVQVITLSALSAETIALEGGLPPRVVRMHKPAPSEALLAHLAALGDSCPTA